MLIVCMPCWKLSSQRLKPSVTRTLIELVDTSKNHSFIWTFKWRWTKKMVNDKTKYNVAPRHVFVSLKDRNESNLTIITHIYKNKVRIDQLWKVLEYKWNLWFLRDIYILDASRFQRVVANFCNCIDHWYHTQN